MKKALVLSLLVGIAATAAAQQAQPAAPAGKPAAPAMGKADAVNMEMLNQAITESRRQFFAAGMSNLTPQQLETFWGVFADFEKEKDAISAARLQLLNNYVENFSTLSDADITKMVNAASEIQKQTTDLRLKYFGILSQKINARVAGRFAHIDDYLTTALRLNILDNMPALGAEPAKK
jgi:hypothetical protein